MVLSNVRSGFARTGARKGHHVKGIALGLAVVCFIIALGYLFGMLQIGTSHGGRHVSHFVLFAVLGVLSLIWMRFASASAARR